MAAGVAEPVRLIDLLLCGAFLQWSHFALNLAYYCVSDVNQCIIFCREYCANGRQHTQVCLLLVELSVDLRELFDALILSFMGNKQMC